MRYPVVFTRTNKQPEMSYIVELAMTNTFTPMRREIRPHGEALSWRATMFEVCRGRAAVKRRYGC